MLSRRILAPAFTTVVFGLSGFWIVHYSLARHPYSGAVEVALFSTRNFVQPPVIELDSRDVGNTEPRVVIRLPAIRSEPHTAGKHRGGNAILFVGGAGSCADKRRHLNPTDIDNSVQMFNLPSSESGKTKVSCSYEGAGQSSLTARSMTLAWFSPNWAQGFKKPKFGSAWHPVESAEVKFLPPEGEGPLSVVGGTRLSDEVPSVRIATIAPNKPVSTVTAHWTSERALQLHEWLLLIAGAALGVTGTGLYELVKSLVERQ